MRRQSFTSLPAVGLLLAALLFVFAAVPALATVKASIGPYEVSLTTEPAVILVGKAQLRLTITDRSGNPVEGANVRVLTGMPGMYMGEKEVPAIPVAGKPGQYTAFANFPHAGAYQSSVTIAGPGGSAEGVLPLSTGQDTGEGAGGFPIGMAAFLILALALIAFTLYRVRKTGQRVNWSGIANRQVLGGLILLAVMVAGAVYAVNNFRRHGAMTPVEAQAMEMNTPAPPGVLPVELVPVSRESIAETVRYTGQAIPYVEQSVYPRVTGTIVWMPSYEGDRVTKGQLLARLDTSQIEPQVAERQAMADEAAQEVGVMRTEHQEALTDISRMRAEARGKENMLTGARAEVRAAQAERTGAEADVAAADAKIADVEADVAAMKADVEYWRAQIKRSTALYKAGAVSGEELQKEQAEAEGAEAKLRQANARVTEAKAEKRAAQSMLRRADAAIAAAEAEVRRAQAEIYAAQSGVRAAEAKANTAKQRISQAQAGVRRAGAGVAAVATQQGYTKIFATTDGVITERLISPGVLVNPGQAILRVAQVSPIRLQANVAESDLARIAVGSHVMVSGRAGKEKPLHAKVTSVRPAVDPQARTGVVEAVVSNTNRRYLPGEYVVMEITTGQSDDALSVPVRAVQRRAVPDAAGGSVTTTDDRAFVWVAEPVQGDPTQLIARRVEVQTGASDGKKVAIRSGLSEGQQVIVSGFASLTNGTTVARAETIEKQMQQQPPASSGGGHEGHRMAEGGASSGEQTATIAVTESGYEPASITLKAGVPAKLTFIRKAEATCGTEIVIPDYKINQPLPLNKPVTVTFTPTEPGEMKMTCGMDMFRGKVVVQ